MGNMMKLLCDASNIIYASYFADYNNLSENNFDENFIRHLFLSKLLYFKKLFHVKSSDIILCWDHRINWRKEIFKHYKESRKKQREKSDKDFETLFKIVNDFYEELLKYFPFTCLKLKWLEGDDWISVLAQKFSKLKESVVIISTDKDFLQLQILDDVMQFNHIKGIYMEVKNPGLEQKLKILCGDVGDGIPNILSDSDTFVNEEKRQKPFGEKKALKLINQFDSFEDEFKDYLKRENLLENFERNNRLINLFCIPGKLQERIVNEYVKNNPVRNKSELARYFVSKEMNGMYVRIEEFF